MQSSPNNVKILILGNSGIGKTAFLSRYFDKRFSDKHTPTIGFEVKNKKVYESGVTYQVQVWDTAGQERFCSLPSMHYNAAEGVIFAFDLQNEVSFECLDKLLESINEKIEEENDIPKILVGMKCDLPRKIIRDVAETYAHMNKMIYFETSAKENIMVEESVDHIILQSILRKKIKETANLERNLSLTKIIRDRRTICCNRSF